MGTSTMKVAILASGEGTNAERLIEAAENRTDIEIAVVASNRRAAGALRRSERLGVPTWAFSKAQLHDGSVAQELVGRGVQFVVLMGFLLKVPQSLVGVFSGRMLNLHPSLLPAFGGKGMYGDHVHRAVYEAMQGGTVTATGMTLHWVDAGYDTGAVFFQARVELDAAADTPLTISAKVRKLEAEHCAQEALRAVSESLSLSGTIDPETNREHGL